MRAWLTNGEVAWQIPPGRIANFFLKGYYLPPPEWRAHDDALDPEWERGKFGEMRRKGGLDNGSRSKA